MRVRKKSGGPVGNRQAPVKENQSGKTKAPVRNTPRASQEKLFRHSGKAPAGTVRKKDKQASQEKPPGRQGRAAARQGRGDRITREMG